MPYQVNMYPQQKNLKLNYSIQIFSIFVEKVLNLNFSNFNKFIHSSNIIPLFDYLFLANTLKVP